METALQMRTLCEQRWISSCSQCWRRYANKIKMLDHVVFAYVASGYPHLLHVCFRSSRGTIRTFCCKLNWNQSPSNRLFLSLCLGMFKRLNFQHNSAGGARQCTFHQFHWLWQIERCVLTSTRCLRGWRGWWDEVVLDGSYVYLCGWRFGYF